MCSFLEEQRVQPLGDIWGRPQSTLGFRLSSDPAGASKSSKRWGWCDQMWLLSSCRCHLKNLPGDSGCLPSWPPSAAIPQDELQEDCAQCPVRLLEVVSKAWINWASGSWWSWLSLAVASWLPVTPIADISNISNQHNLVGGLEHFLFFHIFGMSSSQLTNSHFSDGLKPPTSNQLQGFSMPAMGKCCGLARRTIQMLWPEGQDV